MNTVGNEAHHQVGIGERPERYAAFPVKVAALSRFTSEADSRKALEGIADGTVDVVIGTHRLLTTNVRFKDLGLVVIDEEQRFGVLHKEKFKRLRTLVDVLTLSATPIPRTLYLALTGARDMSTIQTPPHDRLPVETIVTEYDERLIRDAIQREGLEITIKEPQAFARHIKSELDVMTKVVKGAKIRVN